MLRPAAVRSPLGYGGMPRRPRARLVGRVCNEPYTKLLQNRRTLFTEPWDVLLEPSDAFYRTVGPNFLQNRGTELFTEPWDRTNFLQNRGSRILSSSLWSPYRLHPLHRVRKGMGVCSGRCVEARIWGTRVCR